MVNILGNIVCGAVAIRDYGSARRNFIGDCPCFWVLVDFRSQIKEPLSWLIGSTKEVSLFGRNVLFLMKILYYLPDLQLCLFLNGFIYTFVIGCVTHLSISFS